MRHNPNIAKILNDIGHFFCTELPMMDIANSWTRDSQWTDGIHSRMADLGHQHGLRVFATQIRCPKADGPEWLYDHHWRAANDGDGLVRIPLVMEIEWGFGSAKLFECVKKDFLKLVQARADVRVMVFHGNNIPTMTDNLISLADCFEGTQQGDQYFFAGWG
jgi:hypothetical protein